MPIKIGSFVDASPSDIPVISGKPDVSPNTGTTVGTEREGGEPTIINGFEAYSPDTARIDSESAPKRRGRKPGSKNRVPGSGGTTAGPEKETVPGSLIDLSVLLMSIHNLGAAILQVEELELDEGESKKLADGIKEVAKFYPVGLSPKKLAIANLGIIACEIYGTRALAFRLRKKKEAAEKPKLIQMSTTRPPAPPQPTRPAAGGPEKPNGKTAGFSPIEVFGFEAPRENNTF